MPVLDDLIQTLKNLNGRGTLQEIYDEYSKINTNPRDSTVRYTLQAYSSDTPKTYKNKGDFFYSVEGIRSGVWGLRDYEINVINNPDEEEEENKTPKRSLFLSNRIIRDTALASTIKTLIGNKCQLCDEIIILPDGRSYIEAHHIKPLGSPYNGPDIKTNILIVCPNCHVKCDYKVISLNIDGIKNNLQNINQEFINFHNELYEILINK